MTGGRGSPRAGRMMVSSQMSTPEWRSSAALYVRIRTNKEFWSRAAFRLRPTSRYSSRPAQYFNWKKWENGQKGRSGQTLGSGRLECLGRGSYRPRGAMIPTSARRPPADTAGRRWRTWRWRQPHQAWGSRPISENHVVVFKLWVCVWAIQATPRITNQDKGLWVSPADGVSACDHRDDGR